MEDFLYFLLTDNKYISIYLEVNLHIEYRIRLKMFGIEELKEYIEINKTFVECPVKGCNKKVDRQREVFHTEERFKCPIHNIYI